MGKRIVYGFVALLALLALYCGIQDPATLTDDLSSRPQLSVSVQLGTEAETLDLWRSGEGDYHVFLPAGAEQASFAVAPGDDLTIDGNPVTDGMPLEAFPAQQPLSLAWTAEKQSVTANLTIHEAPKIPTVCIDVQSGNMDYIHRQKGNEEKGNLRLYGADGSLQYRGNLEFLRGRGNATWELTKKPYNLRLVAQADLLGMGAAENWVLLANAFDDSAIRNMAVLDAAQSSGLAYSPQCEWVELYLNGEYAGLYLLGESNEIHESRVNIAGDSRFLVSIELEDRLKAQSQDHITTQSGTALRIHESGLSNQHLIALWQSVENAIVAENGIDPETGKHWSDLIDLDSWARKYWIEEVFGNLDAGRISQYFYSDGGKIHAGPVWDYDVSMGSRKTWQLSSPEIFCSGRPHLATAEDVSWFYELEQKPEFKARLKELYRDVYRPLLETFLNEDIDRYASDVAASTERNRLRWQTGDPAEETEWIRSYMTKRLAFLDSVWLEDTEYCRVLVSIRYHGMACYAIRPGEKLPWREVPTGTDTIIYTGWHDSQTGEPYDFDQPVYTDKLIYLNEEGMAQSGASEESPLRAAIKYAPTTVLLMLLAGLLLVSRSVRKRTEQTNHERTEQNEIPS